MRLLIERAQDGARAVDEGLDEFRFGRTEVELCRKSARGADQRGTIGVDGGVLFGVSEARLGGWFSLGR